MKRRSARLLLVVVFALIVAGSGAALWLLHSSAGARWLWTRVENASGDRLSAASIEGTLSGGLTMRDLRYRDDARAVAIERVVLDINPDLFPTRLVIESLRVESVLLEPQASPAAADDGEPLRLAEILARLKLPIPLLVRQAIVTDVETVRGDGVRQVLLSSLELRGQHFESIDVTELELVTPDVELTLAGGLELAAPFAIAPGTRLTVATAGEQPLRAAIELGGSLEDADLKITGESPAVSVTGTMALLEPEVRFRLTVKSPRLTWPLRSDEPMLALEELQLEASGRPSDYAVRLQTDFLSNVSGRVQASARGGGSLEGLRVDALDLRSAEIDASARGELDWGRSFAVDADIDLRQLDPSRWIADWPETSTVSGAIAGSYSALRLELRRFDLRHSGSPAELDGSGVVDFAAAVVDGDLTWEELQWPLPPSAAAVQSRSGRLSVEGTPDDWAISGDVAVGAPGLADGRFRIKGQGDRDRLVLDIEDSEVLGGRVTGDLSYSWRDTRAWSAALSAQTIRIQPFLPDWPGQLSADFRAHGQQAPLEVDVDIASLNGQLRGRAIGAHGRLSLAGGNLRADKLRITTGESQILLDGNYRDATGLSFDVTLASLGAIVGGASGEVEASGNVAASDALPLLELDLTASDLRWQGYHVDRLSIRNRASAETPFALLLDASDVTAVGKTFSRASLSLDGSAHEHHLEGKTEIGGTSARLLLEGGLDQISSLPDARWDGLLAALTITSGDALSLTLQEPRDVRLSAQSMTLQRSCLDAGGAAAVCASASWSGTGAYASVIELSEVPLSLLRLVAESDLHFTQTLTGTVQVSKPPRGRISAGGQIDVSPGEIRNTLDERLTLRTRPGFARFALNEGSLLAGELRLPFSDTAEVAADFSVVDVGRGVESPVEGRIMANVSDIGVGSSIVPAIDDAAGRLQADIRIDGTLDAPQFTGSASLEDGLIAYDPLGVRIEDIQLDGQIRAGNRIDVTSTFRAGEGRGEITTSGDYLQGRQAGLELSFAGRNLTLINVPDLVVKADADLRFGLQNDDVTINGRVVLPEARLSSVSVTATTVNESPDVELVGPGAAESEEQQQAASPLRFSGSVDLELGDEVVVDVDVAEARLQGASTFAWNGPAMPTASGLYSLSGKIQAYGQLLEITEGSIRYPDVTADRPELRIRAEREIFGNSQVRRAGVLVTGTAIRPSIEVYTTPATTAERALTLLVTGSDFDYEQGVGAVDVGTYIAPRLYASYGIGLFDKENVISVRYDLASGFGIKATSGKEASGVDLSYTIEH